MSGSWTTRGDEPPSELRTLLTGLAMGQSPRWHEGRRWLSGSGAQEILAVDLVGSCGVAVPHAGTLRSGTACRVEALDTGLERWQRRAVRERSGDRNGYRLLGEVLAGAIDDIVHDPECARLVASQ